MASEALAPVFLPLRDGAGCGIVGRSRYNSRIRVTTPAHPEDTPEATESVTRALADLGLIAQGDKPAMTRLTGGVSSDIWRVELPSGPACIKRALPKLRVEKPWFAPVSRNAYEVAWMRAAAAVEPDAVPAVIAEDADAGMFVMAYLDPADHPVWKAELRDGVIDPDIAAAVGARIGAIHAATADRDEVAQRFPTDDIFYAIRLEPYLIATAEVHPDRAEPLHRLADITAATKRTLVHGDVSPKNILIGPRGPVFLDAECAWYGDPAFDLAFCLNHLLLKCLWRPQWRDHYLAAFAALAGAYRERVTWEPAAILEARTARLLPGLFLGRVDGKSPVEYVEREDDRNAVRRVARELLAAPVDTLAAVAERWRKELSE